MFTATAPWLDTSRPLDLVFTLTLSDGTQDLLTGAIDQIEVQGAAPAQLEAGWNVSELVGRQDLLLTAGAGLVGGILLTLLIGGGRSTAAPRGMSGSPTAGNAPEPDAGNTAEAADITPLRRSAGGVRRRSVSCLVISCWRPRGAPTRTIWIAASMCRSAAFGARSTRAPMARA